MQMVRFAGVSEASKLVFSRDAYLPLRDLHDLHEQLRAPCILTDEVGGFTGPLTSESVISSLGWPDSCFSGKFSVGKCRGICRYLSNRHLTKAGGLIKFNSSSSMALVA